VSVVLGVVVLDEAVTAKKLAGIGFGVVAVVLLAS
jgi:multidrug transporter EmrE-like cation transporter